MAYAQNSLIQAADYNNFAVNVNAFWGAGAGNRGYGQTALATNIAATNTVTAQQWAALFNAIEKTRIHQTGAGPGLPVVAATNLIAAVGSIGTLITAANTNPAPYTTGLATTANAQIHTATSTSWTTSATRGATLTWTSGAAAMRYFFNAGGSVAMDVITSTLAGNTKSLDWDALCIDAGTVTIRAQSTDRSSTSTLWDIFASGTGFYGLSNNATLTNLYRQRSPTATGGYSNNTLLFSANTVGAIGTANAMFLQIFAADGATDVLDDNVIGTLQMRTTVNYPASTQLANTWGAVTQALTSTTQA